MPLQLLLCASSYTFRRPVGDRIMGYCFCETVLSMVEKKNCCDQKEKREIIC